MGFSRKHAMPYGGYAPNGNLMAHSDSVMGDWLFDYDTLNGLTVAAPADNAPSNYAHTIGCFGYDSFGNRTMAGFIGNSDCSSSRTATATYNSKNQVTLVSQGAPISYSAPSGFSYDNAGNATVDGKNSYRYDAEGRICAVAYVSGGVTLYRQYLYDAEGLRVGKATIAAAGFPALGATCAAPGAASGFALTNEYLLDQGGDQVTELNGSGVWQHSNVWAGAHLEATYDTAGVHFQLSDPLGTRRIETDAAGTKDGTYQSLPFGDNEVTIGHDATENHFTGKEHDGESGNDYFEARYYNSSVGRFMSPDWAASAEAVPYAEFDEPQSLNLYAYVRNNPLGGADPSGHWPSFSDAVDFVSGAVNAFGIDNALGAGRQEQSSASGRIGAAVGDAVATVQGVTEAAEGAAGLAAGTALTATG